MRTLRLGDRSFIPWRALGIGMALLLAGPTLAPRGASAAPEGPAAPATVTVFRQPVVPAPAARDAGERSDGLAGTPTTTGILSASGYGNVNGPWVSWTVQVLPSGATGIVTVTDGTGGTCQITLPATSCQTVPLAAGVYTITASYAGDGTYDPSIGYWFNFFFAKANTSVSLASSSNPSSVGSSVTFTATVNESPSGPANPTGTVSFYDGTTLLGTGAVSGNVATFSTSALAVGNHPIKATYNGDANFNGSTSGILNQSVTKLTSSISLVSSQNPSVYGQSVTFTATVSGSAGTPTGTVTFDDGNTVLAARSLSSGTASFTVSWLEARTHPIRAVYHGDETYLGSNSSTLNQVVNKASTSVTLTRTPAANTVYGEPVTFTANLAAVAPGAGTPTGFVLFQDGGVTIGIGLVDGTGEAEFATSSLTVASHTMTAVYGGDANYLGVTSSSLAHTVTKANTTTTLARTTDVAFPANPSKYGQNVILTATVTTTAPGSGVPAGSVTFYDGATPLGTVNLNADGQAIFQTTALAVGGHSFTATYNGSANHNSSTSAAMAHTVQKADTTTVVVDPPVASSYVFGQSFLLSAQVSVVAPGAGIPTGEVRFQFVNNGTLATWMFGANAYVAAPLAPNGTAQTVIPLTFYPDAATYSITATYVGDSNFNASPASAARTVTINPAATTLSVTSSLNPSVYGQAIVFPATISVTSPGSMIPATTDPNKVPTGTVTLTLTPTVGPPIVAVGNLTLVSGQPFNATVQINPGALPVETYSVQGVYNPGSNPNFLGSNSTAFNQVVNKANTKTLLSSSPNPSLSGQSVALTADVSVLAPGSGTPTGTVTFKNGASNIAGCVGVALVGTQAVCNTAFGTGTHTLTAEYNGSANFNTSVSGGITQTVNTAPTTVTLVDNSVPLTTLFGQPATFDVTVTATSGTPAGTVAFRRAGVVIAGCGSVALVAGAAQCVTSALPTGDNPISAVYTPTSDHAGGTSNTIFHTVAGAATTTTLSRLPNASTVYGEPVTFTAVVSSGAGTPTGTVAFKSDGVTFAQVALSGGTASFTIASLPVGTHTISAVYLGSASFAGSTGTLAHTVTAASTNTAVTSSVNPSVFGQLVTFSATVTAVAPGTGTPTGTVTFKDGAATIGVGNLNAGGVASYTTSLLTVGPHAISAVYGGDANFATSTGNLPTQTVNPAPTTTTVTGAPNPSILGSPVTFTAVVAAAAPGSGVPTGAVTFKDGATNIAGCVGVALVGGQATCVTSALALGPHTIWADYGGSASFTASSGSTPHTVSNTPVDLAVTKTSTPNPVQAGTNLTYVITVQNLSSVGSDVTLTDPLPTEVTFLSVSAPGGWGCSDPGVGNTGTVTCSTPTLPAMSSATITLVVYVPLETPAGTVLFNTASVSGGFPDPNLANNASNNETTVYRFRRP